MNRMKETSLAIQCQMSALTFVLSAHLRMGKAVRINWLNSLRISLSLILFKLIPKFLEIVERGVSPAWRKSIVARVQSTDLACSHEIHI